MSASSQSHMQGLELESLPAEDPQTAGIPFVLLTVRVYRADKVAGLGKRALG